MKIVSAEDTLFLNILVYGVTGSGKTHLAGTAADCEATSPVLLVDFEAGTLTIRGKAVDIVRPRSWADVQEVYDMLASGKSGYRCVVLDTLTEMQRALSLASIVGSGASAEDLEATPVPTRQDWLRTGDQMRKVIRAFRNLAYQDDPEARMHVLMLAHERSDERLGVVCPQLSGQLGVEAGAFVDVLARLTTFEETDDEGNTRLRRYLLLSEHVSEETKMRYLAKARGVQARGIFDPDMSKILSLWEGN